MKRKALNELANFLKLTRSILSRNSNYEAQMQALEGIGYFIDQGIKLLEKVSISKKSELVKLTAIEELENIKARWTLSTLLLGLNDKSPLVRGDVAIVLSSSNSLEVRKSIQKVCKKEKNPEAKVRFLLALYKFDPKSVGKQLTMMISHPHYRVRILATRSWAHICNKQDGRLLYRKLKELQKIGDVRAVTSAITDSFHILWKRFGHLK